ncbi:hypothetical protein R5W24_003693 [Gemmata sp. JC717]|uniref:Cytochrome c n=1 Tax=Gemmata algarum TaxID=2975278 RepID=A0ABU5F586_9BACT|nr:hypothetical protein [Gemmata algarum]MDY3554569.1 hypothetical protein [Gemmata algarum]MDY3562743.1 hypothetical protein [Gemmata algarum]
MQKLIRASLFAALGAAAVLFAFGSVTAAPADDKLPEIAEIMKKGHAKTDGYITKVKEAVKGGKWEDAQKYAKDMSILGTAIGKNKPPKGDDKSWKALTDKYADTTQKILKGTEDKDAKATNAAIGSMVMSCGGCHSKHKP